MRVADITAISHNLSYRPPWPRPSPFLPFFLPSPWRPPSPFPLFRSAGGRVCVEEREKGRSTPAGRQNTAGGRGGSDRTTGRGRRRRGKRSGRERESADGGGAACNSVTVSSQQRGWKDAVETDHLLRLESSIPPPRAELTASVVPRDEKMPQRSASSIRWREQGRRQRPASFTSSSPSRGMLQLYDGGCGRKSLPERKEGGREGGEGCLSLTGCCAGRPGRGDGGAAAPAAGLFVGHAAEPHALGQR